jgi:hypothetical protein
MSDVKVKIELLKGMTPEQAEDLLFKAFQAQRTGETHGEEYNDPAMKDTLNRMIEIFKKEQDAMIQEISEALDAEYKAHGNF